MIAWDQAYGTLSSDCYRNIVTIFVQPRRNNGTQVLVSFYKLFPYEQNMNKTKHFHRNKGNIFISFDLLCYFVLIYQNSP